jgi:hypothetical protein
MSLKMMSTMIVAALASLAAAQDAPVKPAEAKKGQAPPLIRSQVIHWAKVRLDEIDATLSSLDGQVTKLQGDARAKADSALADMRAKRDAFRQTIQKESEKIGDDWSKEKAAREVDWKAFESAVQQYLDRASARVEQHKAAFQARADAQRKAWEQAIDRLQADAAKIAAENKVEADAALKQMKADASAAQAKLEKLKVAGAESWAAYQQALTDSRAAFDRANQAALDALAK